jgi:hypothetical protein
LELGSKYKSNNDKHLGFIINYGNTQTNMKKVKDMTLVDIADLLDRAGVTNPEISAQLRSIDEEYKRQWNNLSAAQKLDALAYPPDPNSVTASFLKHMENAEKRIQELEQQLEDIRESYLDRPI